MTKYTLQVELDRLPFQKVAITLYAALPNGRRTGLMNCNKLGSYVAPTLLSEESSDPLITSEPEASWLIFSVLKDWQSWESFLELDMQGQDMG
jgi:hypothetical protein